MLFLTSKRAVIPCIQHNDDRPIKKCLGPFLRYFIFRMILKHHVLSKSTCMRLKKKVAQLHMHQLLPYSLSRNKFTTFTKEHVPNTKYCRPRKCSTKYTHEPLNHIQYWFNAMFLLQQRHVFQKWLPWAHIYNLFLFLYFLQCSLFQLNPCTSQWKRKTSYWLKKSRPARKTKLARCL